MPESLESSLLAPRGLCDLAISALQGRWAGFWELWETSGELYRLDPSRTALGLAFLDYLASERRLPLAFHADAACWPKGTSAALSSAGIECHGCLSSNDGHRLLDAVKGIGREESPGIAVSYGIAGDDAATAIEEVVAYFEQIAAAVADREENRLLIISFETGEYPGAILGT